MNTADPVVPLGARERLFLLARQVSRFLRLAAAGATVAIPLLGAVSALSELRLGTMLGIAAVAVSHHVFSFVLNDVVDLPIDRTEPRRSRSPLVQGKVSPRFALVFALANVPLALLVSSLLGAGRREQVILIGSMVLIAVYDIWGKRFRVPPLVDGIQGVGWAMLAWYGAEIAGGATSVTAWLCLFLISYILLANGVHGGLRDLGNDLERGARTTPLYMGAEPRGDGESTCPTALRRYALTVEAVNAVLAGGVLLALRYEGWTLTISLAAWTITALTSALLLRRALSSTRNRRQMMVLGTLHLIVSFAVVVVVLLPVMPLEISVFVLLVYTAPLLAYGWLFDAILRVPAPRSPR